MSLTKEEHAPCVLVTFDPSSSKGIFRMKKLDDWIARIFDESPLGILRIGLNFAITYANRKAMELCGIHSFEGRSILEFVPDQGALDLWKAKLSRQEGMSEEYETEIVRNSDQQRVPVKVVGMPARDTIGQVAGTVGMLRTLELERTSQVIKKYMQSSRTGEELLQAVAEQTRQVIPAAGCSVTLYSEKLEYARLLFTDSKELADKPSPRWSEMTPLLRAWAQNTETVIIPNYFEFLQKMNFDREYLQTLQSIPWKSFLCHPIVREGRAIGSFALMSQQLYAYNEEHKKMLQALPLDTALATALHYEEVRELEFRLDLLRDVLRCEDNADIFSLLVNRLANHYKCRTIAVYKVEEASQAIVLQTQTPGCSELINPAEQAIDQGILGYVYRKGEDVNIGNVEKDLRFKDLFSRISQSTRSELCMPIKVGGSVYALLNIEDSKENAFAPEEVTALRLVLSEVETALEGFRSRKLQQSMQLAREVQLGLLPQKFPAFPNKSEVDVFATNKPALEVGGDFYDFFLLDDDHLCFVIGDVSDKGIPAALFMAVVRTAFRISAMATQKSICAVLRTVNQFITGNNNAQMFVTMLAGIMDLRTGTIEYVNGGHEPPFIMRWTNAIEMVGMNAGLALGLSPEATYHTGVIQLQPEDVLVLYTDGVNEAMNMDRQQYRTATIGQALETCYHQSCATISHVILDSVSRWVGDAPQSDDITILVIRYCGSSRLARVA